MAFTLNLHCDKSEHVRIFLWTRVLVDLWRPWRRANRAAWSGTPSCLLVLKPSGWDRDTASLAAGWNIIQERWHARTHSASQCPVTHFVITKSEQNARSDWCLHFLWSKEITFAFWVLTPLVFLTPACVIFDAVSIKMWEKSLERKIFQLVWCVWECADVHP